MIWALLSLLTLVCSSQLDATRQCIHQYIDSLKPDMDQNIFDVFQKAFPNTLQTTIQHFQLDEGSEETYIITGDIEAMWLRDSTNQFLPYIRMPTKCPHIQSLSLGLLNTQAQFIMLDGYTNAFKRFEDKKQKRPFYLNDVSETLIMGMQVDLCRRKEFATPSIWERKFEIDSLASFLRLSYEHYLAFDSIKFVNLKWIKAIRRLLSVLDEEINDATYEKQNNMTFYTFYRDNKQLPGGHIKPSKRTGMIKTGFRPSDDPTDLPYNIPGNAMAATYLKLVAEKVIQRIQKSSIFYSLAETLKTKMLYYSETITEGIYEHGVITRDGKEIFAYEVNGFGDYKLIDDANLPSLLSLPYLRFVEVSSKIYQNTREYILSARNPYYYGSGSINGIGSSHTSRDYIWPLALMTQILTTDKDAQIRNCLDSLLTSAKNNLLHESFNVRNPGQYTREWFAWANSFFGETIVHVHQTRKKLLKK